MKILVVSSWDGGGVSTAIGNIAAPLSQRGVRYSAFGWHGWHKNTRWANFCDNLYSDSEVKLTELLVREHFDVVHLVDTACPPPYNVNLWLERARYRGGIVCMSQNAIQELLPNQKGHVFVACSQGSRDVMARTISHPIRVVHNGVDVQKFQPVPVEKPQRPILLWVGRALDFKQKDTHGFLYLAANLLQSNYDFLLVDGGDDPDALRLKDWFGDRVRYASNLSFDELVTVYSQVAASGGAMISTSTFEGFQFVMAEAASCGCPMIAPLAPGLEWIENDGIGLTYAREAALQGLLDCLKQLEDAGRREELVDAAHQAIARTYNNVTMAEGYYQCYLDAIELSKQAPAETARDRMTRRFWAKALSVRHAPARRKATSS